MTQNTNVIQMKLNTTDYYESGGTHLFLIDASSSQSLMHWFSWRKDWN